MIVGFVGTPGSGKSYDAVKKILFNLKKGRHVYTNIDGMDDPGHQENIKMMCGLDDWAFDRQFHFLKKDEVPQFWKIARPGSMIVLDEIHKVFNCRDWQSKKNLDFADWASTHRHYGFDLILITQDMEKVEKQVRSLLEWTYVYRKVNFFGGAVQRKYICYSFGGDETRGKPLAQSVKTYETPVFACYKSFATKDAKEVGFMRHVNVLKHPVFIAIPLVFCLALYLLFGKSSLASGDIFGTKSVREKQAKLIDDMKRKKQSQTVKTASPALPIQQSYSGSSYQVQTLSEWQTYPIDGYVRDGNGKIAIMVNGFPTKLPNENLRKVNLMTMICEGKTQVFGIPK